MNGWVLFVPTSMQTAALAKSVSQCQIQYICWKRFSSVELVFFNKKQNFVTKLTSSTSNTIKNYLKSDLSLSTHLLTVSSVSINGLCLFSISLVRQGKNSSYSILSYYYYSHSKAFNMFKQKSLELLALSAYCSQLSKGTVKSSRRTL